MNETGTNAPGLYGRPVRSPDIPDVETDGEALRRQIAASAFLLDREEALAEGFLSPYDAQDLVRVRLREEDAS